VRDGKTGARVVRALPAIRPADGGPQSVFGVTESTLRWRAKATAKAVAAEGVTCHSGRVGGPYHGKARRRGPRDHAAGGWQSSATVARYTRKLAAMEAVLSF